MSEIITKRSSGYLDVGLSCDEPSLTKQAEAAACDINKIMAKYEKSGLILHLNQNEAMYADVSSVPDYQGALAIVQKADEMFGSLPAEIRARFENDPAKYLSFVADPANKELMQTMGMIAKVPDAPPSMADGIVEALTKAGVVVPAVAPAKV